MTIDADDIKRLRQRLDTREAELRAELRTVQDDRDSAPGRVPATETADTGEQGEQRLRDAVREVEQERDAEELRAIGGARDRMTSGSYGACIDCGNDIPLARLQAQPAAARCVPCQERYERSHPSVPKLPLQSLP